MIDQLTAFASLRGSLDDIRSTIQAKKESASGGEAMDAVEHTDAANIMRAALKDTLASCTTASLMSICVK